MNLSKSQFYSWFKILKRIMARMSLRSLVYFCAQWFTCSRKASLAAEVYFWSLCLHLSCSREAPRVPATQTRTFTLLETWANAAVTVALTGLITAGVWLWQWPAFIQAKSLFNRQTEQTRVRMALKHFTLSAHCVSGHCFFITTINLLLWSERSFGQEINPDLSFVIHSRS